MMKGEGGAGPRACGHATTQGEALVLQIQDVPVCVLQDEAI